MSDNNEFDEEEYDFESQNEDTVIDVDAEDEGDYTFEDTDNGAAPSEVTRVSDTAELVNRFNGDISVNHSSESTVTIVHLDDDGVEQSQIIDLSSPPLSRDEAENLTNNIRTQTNVLYLLIARAHAGKAHLALGYNSFENYIKEEFNYSKSYAYKLINQSNIINAIQEVMPEGAQVYVSDNTARGLKASLGEFIPELEERVSNVPASEAGEVMEDLIKEYRDRRDETNEEDDEDDDFDGEYNGGGTGNGQGGGDLDYSFDDDDEDEGYEDAFGDEDPAVVRRRLEAVYNLYSSLGQFAQMPPNDEIIKIIPVERRPQVTAYLESAIAWLNEFEKDWKFALEDSDEETNENSDEDNSEDFD